MNLNEPTFETWNPVTLVKFAYDANRLMKQQADRIEQLQQDNKDLHKILKTGLANGTLQNNHN